MTQTLALAWDVLFRPTRAFRRMQTPGSALVPSLAIYAFAWTLSVLFYAFKPPDFPMPEGETAVLVSHSAGYWLGVEAVGFGLTLAWLPFLAALVRLFQGGRLFGRLCLAAGWACLPILLAALYHMGVLSRPAFVASWLLVALPLAALLRTSDGTAWGKIAALIFASNAIAAVSLVPMAAAVALRAEWLYMGCQYLQLFWILGWVSKGLKTLVPDLSTARAFLAFFVSMTFPVFALFALHFLGLVSPDFLKVFLMP